MSDRLAFLWPEIALFVATCIVMIVGLSRGLAARKSAAVVAGIGLLVALFLSIATTPHSKPAVCPISGVQFADALMSSAGEVNLKSGQLLLPDMVPYAKVLIAAVGLLMLLVQAGTVDRLEEKMIAEGKRVFDPLRTNRAEYYAFFLFSLTGLMLVASADDLIWLFLALELTSLPTYIMVAISSARNRSREAGVKYFFLGALGAAIFLYGFALIYGGTGSTNLNTIAMAVQNGGINSVTMAGMLLALVGLGFKIAAVPMHFYTADVYQGAASQVSAFLAFVPKAAGFLAILLLCLLVGVLGSLSALGMLGQADEYRLRERPEERPDDLGPLQAVWWSENTSAWEWGNVAVCLAGIAIGAAIGKGAPRESKRARGRNERD
jgi:NADH-quinone oxidoreductase subunit N